MIIAEGLPHTHTDTAVQRPFVLDYPGGLPVPEETVTLKLHDISLL